MTETIKNSTVLITGATGAIAKALIAALTAFGGSVQSMFGRVRDNAGSAMDSAGI